jgi:hypothetical protein
MNFLQLSRDFTSFSKMAILLKFHFCNDVPRTFQSLIDTPLDCTTHPGKKWALAMRPSAIGAARLRPIPVNRRRSLLGRWWGLTTCSPRALWWPKFGRRGRRRGCTAGIGGGGRGGWCYRRGGARPRQGVVRLGPRDDGETPREFTRHSRGMERRVRQRRP